jgi:hypothetical protein
MPKLHKRLDNTARPPCGTSWKWNKHFTDNLLPPSRGSATKRPPPANLHLAHALRLEV